MFKCTKCNKEFLFESKLIIHQNRKTPCNKIKPNLNCNLCKVEFFKLSKLKRHENTNKHIKNYNKYNQTNKDNTTKDNIILETKELKNHIKELENYIKELKNHIKELENELTIKTKEYEIYTTELENKLTIKTKELFISNSKIKKLEMEIELLKSNNIYIPEYIYIVHERSFVLSNLNIYKIGRTKNIKNRLQNYTKGSICVFQQICKDSKSLEKEILDYLKLNNHKYYHAKEYGNEYFKCDLFNLIDDITLIIKK